MKRNLAVWSILSITIFVILFIIGYMGLTGKYKEYILKKESEPMIEKIEGYKIKNGFYPMKISDVGFPEPDESGPIFYELKDSSSYKVLCALGFEYIYYDSKTKKWYP